MANDFMLEDQKEKEKYGKIEFLFLDCDQLRPVSISDCYIFVFVVLSFVVRQLSCSCKLFISQSMNSFIVLFCRYLEVIIYELKCKGTADF